MGILDFEAPEELKKKEEEQKKSEKKNTTAWILTITAIAIVLLIAVIGSIYYFKFINRQLGDKIGVTKGGNDAVTDIIYKTITSKEPEKIYPPEPTGVTAYVTTDNIESNKLSSCVVVAEKYCEGLKLATIIASGASIPVANLPEGTKIYAPFDGNITIGTAEIAGTKVRPLEISRVGSTNDDEVVSATMLVQTWSNVAGNKTVKKGDYIGTIGKSAAIFDDLSSLKGNNFHFDVVGKGFDGKAYSNAKDYIKGFIKFAETFEVKKLDLNLRATLPVETPKQ